MQEERKWVSSDSESEHKEDYLSQTFMEPQNDTLDDLFQASASVDDSLSANIPDDSHSLGYPLEWEDAAIQQLLGMDEHSVYPSTVLELDQVQEQSKPELLEVMRQLETTNGHLSNLCEEVRELGAEVRKLGAEVSKAVQMRQNATMYFLAKSGQPTAQQNSTAKSEPKRGRTRGTKRA